MLFQAKFICYFDVYIFFVGLGLFFYIKPIPDYNGGLVSLKAIQYKGNILEEGRQYPVTIYLVLKDGIVTDKRIEGEWNDLNNERRGVLRIGLTAINVS